MPVFHPRAIKKEKGAPNAPFSYCFFRTGDLSCNMKTGRMVKSVGIPFLYLFPVSFILFALFHLARLAANHHLPHRWFIALIHTLYPLIQALVFTLILFPSRRKERKSYFRMLLLFLFIAFVIQYYLFVLLKIAFYPWFPPVSVVLALGLNGFIMEYSNGNHQGNSI